MKKMLLLITSLTLLITLNNCQTDNYNDRYLSYVDDDELTTLFLVDHQGYAYAGIPYLCDSMTDWEITLSNGEFTFLSPEYCEFDFNGFDGVYGDRFDDVIRIVDYRDDGKEDINYDCDSFGASSTYVDGSFEYNEDDICTFEL